MFLSEHYHSFHPIHEFQIKLAILMRGTCRYLSDIVNSDLFLEFSQG